METTTTQTLNMTTQSINAIGISVFQVLLTFVLIAIMFGMGCAVDHLKLKENLKRPVGLIIGLISQIIFMPILTYVLIKIFSLTPIQSLAFALIGFSPGGNISNVITYLVNGDISLSVAMTTFSNALALGTLPLWIAIYTAIEQVHDELKISYLSLVITLLSVALPVAAGVAFRYKFPKRTRLIPKVASGCGMVILICTIVVMVVTLKIPFVLSPITILPVSLLPILGILMGYLLSWIPALNIPNSARNAIALETGIQNKGIPNSILILSFGHRVDIYSQAVTIPLIYTISQTVLVILIALTYRLWLRKSDTYHGEQSDGANGQTSTDHHAAEKDPLQRESSGRDCEESLKRITHGE